RWTSPRSAKLLRRLCAHPNNRKSPPRQRLRDSPSTSRNSATSRTTTRKSVPTWLARSIIPTRAKHAEADLDKQQNKKGSPTRTTPFYFPVFTLRSSVYSSVPSLLVSLRYRAPALICSTTDGSRSVDTSPRFEVSPSAILRRIRRMIFPERVLGNPATN